MGWMQDCPPSRDGKREHLIKVGIPEAAVDELLSWLEEHGSLLAQMGIHPSAVGLVRSLHTGA
eukprot:10266763-Karenia_brevis.AAC.1